jgi:YaiO family outer membrane protein
MQRVVLWVAFLVSVGTGALAQTTDVLAEARTLATRDRRAEAIALLRQHLEVSSSDTDARLLLGLVLSWEGAYDDARAELEAVVREHPTYADALAALFNVELWSGRPQNAKAIAERGLDQAPNDSRFLLGRRRAIDVIDSLRPWDVRSGYSYDWFSDHRTAWHETYASLKRATPVGAIILQGTRAKRFSLTDHQFEVEMYPRLRDGTYAYIAGGYAPDQQLYPRYRFAADIYQWLGAGLEGSFGFRRLGFGTVTDIYVGTLNKYVGDWLLTGRVFYVPDRAGQNSKSFHGSFRRYFGAGGTSYGGARYSRGFAREEIRSVNDFEVLGSDTFAVELQSDLGRRWRVSASGSTSRQDRLNRADLRQNSVSASVGFRF